MGRIRLGSRCLFSSRPMACVAVSGSSLLYSPDCPRTDFELNFQGSGFGDQNCVIEKFLFRISPLWSGHATRQDGPLSALRHQLEVVFIGGIPSST